VPAQNPERERGPIGPTDAAQRLGVSTRTVQRWLREGQLPAVQVGGRLKVDPSAFATADAHGAAGTAVPIRRLLIANRGELVVRIARTCRAVGITPIALVTDDQTDAWWAAQLEERVPLHGSYLDGAAVLAAARAAGADAIHPGYGFLAENADFADAVEAAGLCWVGPSGAAMRAVGDKAAGRRLASSIGVPTVPGYDGDDQTDEALRAAATHIGFPLLVKPSAGGGGKGMHVARDASELAETLPRARREAMAAFADERLILERYVERPRHVEVQILADRHGDAVHLGERDCSVQRRHQKVIEEAPSPAVNADLRAQLGDAALSLVRAAGYTNAGTVEFLLDERRNFYFLEVNARLQVEHPVTEAVTGRDLVADQLRIAAGEPLGFSQADVTWTGHAIEARIYAEDPWNDFLPTAGDLEAVEWPNGAGIRVDAGVGAGERVGTRYDPMLAKVVGWAEDRFAAIDTLGAALEQTAIFGVTTNRGFLGTLLADPVFRAGDAATDFIDQTWRPAGPPALDPAFALAATEIVAKRGAGWPSALSTATAGFRLNSHPRIRLRIGDEERWVTLPPASAALQEPRPGLSHARRGGSDSLCIDMHGLAVQVFLAASPTVETALQHTQAAATGSSRVTAPMPGNVLQVRVAAGDVVEQGQVLVVLEAMKMENGVVAPSAGTVERVAVGPGQQVSRGDVLVELR
jgi:excisionase family DNA binding protein